MKGLLLKDFYMTMKYCRVYLFLVAICIIASFASSENMFYVFVFYPCLFSGMIPVTLLAYDERSKWLEYSGTLPYTKTEIVSGKYLIGLIMQIFVLGLTGISQAIRMSRSNIFDWGNYLILMFMLLIIACVATSFYLPFMFIWGVEKGRIGYYVIVALIFAINFSASSIFGTDLQPKISNAVLPILAVAGIALYALSWWLSIVFYKKREV